MAGDSATPVKDLYGGGRVVSVYLLRNQLVRHTVEMVVQFHVIVDVDPQRLPLAEAVGLGRKRLQGGAVELANRSQRLPSRFLKGR
jgi:hypothetical protein